MCDIQETPVLNGEEVVSKEISTENTKKISRENLLKMNHQQHVGPTWAGYDELAYLFVFGDSYSQVGYYDQRSPQPTATEPLGVEFPGDTYNEPGEPNWVGYVARDFKPKGEDGLEKPLLVYDYAVGGRMVDGVKLQVERSFLEHAGKTSEGAAWTESNSLFCIWIGINDTAFGRQAKESLESLFAVMETLFQAGARSFLLLDVPPIHRSPALKSSLPKVFTDGPKSPKPYTTWNKELRKQGGKFTETHSDATLLVFSAYDLFDVILDDPVRFGFSSEDASKQRGAIWFDHIHPTTSMHKLIAENLTAFLKNTSPASDSQA